MNTKRFLCAALGAVCCFAFMQAQVRTEQTFEKGWKFTREDNAEFANPGYNDSKWQNVTVPHDWAIYGPFSINNDKQEMAITQDGQTEALEHAGRTGGLPFVGTGWYRLNFDAPGANSRRRFSSFFQCLIPRLDRFFQFSAHFCHHKFFNIQLHILPPFICTSPILFGE